LKSNVDPLHHLSLILWSQQIVPMLTITGNNWNYLYVGKTRHAH